jgi:hypothetical protein
VRDDVQCPSSVSSRIFTRHSLVLLPTAQSLAVAVARALFADRARPWPCKFVSGVISDAQPPRPPIPRHHDHTPPRATHATMLLQCASSSSHRLACSAGQNFIQRPHRQTHNADKHASKPAYQHHLVFLVGVRQVPGKELLYHQQQLLGPSSFAVGRCVCVCVVGRTRWRPLVHRDVHCPDRTPHG